MTFKQVLAISLVAVSSASAASAAELALPKDSASDLSLFLAVHRWQVYADHCSAKVPRLEPEFDSLMQKVRGRLQEISERLLASDEFRGMREKAVPEQIIFALDHGVHDSEENFKRQDAVSVCPEILQTLGKTDDESLQSGLAEILKSVQTMTENLERQSSR